MAYNANPNNALAYFLFKIKAALPTTRVQKAAPANYSSSWNGNTLALAYNATSKNFTVTTNNVTCYNGTAGEDTLFKALESIIDGEVSGTLKVIRPEGRTLALDKRELSSRNLSRKGIPAIPRLEVILKRYGNITKQGGQKKTLLTQKEFNFFQNQQVINPQDYIFDSYNKFYVNTTHPNVIILKGKTDAQVDKLAVKNIDANPHVFIVNDGILTYRAGRGKIYMYARGQYYNVTSDMA